MIDKLSGTNLVGMSTTRDRVENDFYATPKEAVEQLIKAYPDIKNNNSFWECACGQGHISEVLKEFSEDVFSSDLVNRGYGEKEDFLKSNFSDTDCIITNPPFKLAKEFILHGLKLAKREVIMFAKLQLLEGLDRYDNLFTDNPPKYVYVFVRRVNPLRNGSVVDESGKKWASTMCFAWFVWEVGYKGETIVRWIK